MSTSTGVSSDKQAAVLEYLKQHRINEELNVVVNKLCQTGNEQDPFAFIVRHTQTEYVLAAFVSASTDASACLLSASGSRVRRARSGARDHAHRRS